MPIFIGDKNAVFKPTQRQIYEAKYRTSRMNLLLVVIFTLINLILLAANADVYFLFSAFIPNFITSLGMLFCGRFPEEYYVLNELEGMNFLDSSFFAVLLVISVILTLLYLLAWFMSSKNRVGWLIFALVFFGLDTLGMLFINGLYIGGIIDTLFHAWVIYYLIVGIVAHYKLKKLPPEEIEAPITQQVDGDTENTSPVTTEIPDSSPLREADKEVKNRVLLETRIFNYDVCYRRVKHTSELVINGNVYDEIEGIIENPYMLSAKIDGHSIEAGYTGIHSVIIFDGETVAKKIRIA